MEIRRILEKLYTQNQFICSVTDDRAFRYLETEQGSADVNAALKPFGRKLCRVSGDGAFFIDSIDNANVKDLVERRKQFEHIRDNLEPIVEFFVFISRVKPSLGIMTAGQTLRFSEILNLLTENELHSKQLTYLVSLKMFRTSKQASVDRLQLVFDRMVKEGLLAEKNASDMVYQVTGKYAYVHHVMQFILDRENISMGDSSEEQGEFVV